MSEIYKKSVDDGARGEKKLESADLGDISGEDVKEAGYTQLQKLNERLQGEEGEGQDHLRGLVSEEWAKRNKGEEESAKKNRDNLDKVVTFKK